MEEAKRYREKVEMKNKLVESGVRVPKFKRVGEMTDVIKFIEENGYPVVVKHTKGCGSVNTFIVKDEQNLLSFFDKMKRVEKGLTMELQVEEFIVGEMYHVDGLLYDGEVKLIWPTKYVNLCVNFSSERFLGGFNLHPSNPLTPRLRQYVLEVINSLEGGKSFPFHAEVWVQPNGELVLCEIASRIGGPPIGKSVEVLWGYDMYRVFTESQAGCELHDTQILKKYSEREDPETLVAHCALYPRAKSKLLSYPKEDPPSYVVYYQKVLKEG